MSANSQTLAFIRIIELPTVKMARSGSKDLDEFDRWWSSMDAQDQYNLFPRDFMWFNPQLGDLEWLYALPAGIDEAGGYEVFEFPGGLYAVAACNDQESEIQATNSLIHQWIAQGELFLEVINDGAANPRYDMGHVITPINAKEIMGCHQMDLFVPIVTRKS